MSKTVDEERAADAERARLDRAVAHLEHLLRLVKMRRDELPARVIAERTGIHLRTVYRDEEVLKQLLVVVGQNGKRRRE